MPRPQLKRKRPVAPLHRRVKKIPSSSPGAKHELERKLANKPVGAKPADSDDSDQLVRQMPSLRNRRGIAKQEIFASGGVAKEDTPGAHPSQKRNSSTTKTNRGKKLPLLSNSLQSPTAQRPPNSLLGSAQQPQGQRAKPTQSSPPAALMKPLAAAPTPLGTPNVGASMLGSLKPRRRLPSILQMVESYDSSSINVGDEAEFLPDDESTPMNLRKSATAISTPNPLSSSLSRKRKISQHSIARPEHITQVVASSRSEPELPALPLAMTKSLKRKTPPGDDDDIMAPPESSSSPRQSPVKLNPPPSIRVPRARKSQQPKALSTEALQAFMPKRPKPRRQHQPPAGQFEIPMDSDEGSKSEGTRDRGLEEDEESFIPPGRAKRGKGSALVKRKEAVSKQSNARKKARNERATSTLSPTKNLNTRLPSRSTKSPSQQPYSPSRIASTAAAKGRVTKATPMPKAHMYASRRRQAARNGHEPDKENQHERLSEGLLKGGNEVAFEDGHSGADVDDDQSSAGRQALRAKFAEIDEWDMEFEEVSIASSDPMMR